MWRSLIYITIFKKHNKSDRFAKVKNETVISQKAIGYPHRQIMNKNTLQNSTKKATLVHWRKSL